MIKMHKHPKIPHIALKMHINGFAKKYDLSKKSQMIPVKRFDAIEVTIIVIN